MGALLDITQVAIDRPPELRDAFVEVPRPGSTVEARGLEVAGWVIGASTEVVAVDVALAGRRVARLTVNVERPDLGTAFHGVPGAERAGFRGTISLIGRDPEPQVELHAVLADDRRVCMAVLSTRRHWRRSPAEAERELVSVIVLCHRQARYLPDALSSALAQTYPHVEIVVVDGWLDNAEEVARRQPGVRVVRREREGLAELRNTGIRHTNGDYLVFLDADDQLVPHAVQTGIEQLRARPEAAFTSGRHRHLPTDSSNPSTPPQPGTQDDHFAALLQQDLIRTPGTVMFRRAVFEHVRGFDGSVPGCEDYELRLRIARDFVVSCHGEVIGLNRGPGNGMSGHSEAMIRSAMRALRRQRPYVRGSDHLEAAYREGEARLKRCYRATVRDRVGTAVEEHDWPLAGRVAVTLATEPARSRLGCRRR